MELFFIEDRVEHFVFPYSLISVINTSKNGLKLMKLLADINLVKLRSLINLCGVVSFHQFIDHYRWLHSIKCNIDSRKESTTH